MKATLMGILSAIRNAVAPDTEVVSALAGTGMLSIGGLFAKEQIITEEERMRRYATLMLAYDGRPFDPFMKDGDLEVAVNLNRPIVNKSVDWLMGRMFDITIPTGNEIIVEELWNLLERINFHARMLKMAHSGAIAGDAYVYVSAEALGEDPGALDINFIKPQYVHPIFHPVKTDVMVGCLIQYPVMISQSASFTYGMTEGQAMYSLYITPDKIRTYHDRTQISETPNPFGEIPVFHAQNLLNAFRWNGDSDIVDTYVLNSLRNSALNNVKMILDYYAEPTYVITGARAQNLRKGGGKVWSIKDKDARVEMLQMNADITPLENFFNTLKTSALELANTPEMSLGAEQAISNTSAAALEVRYMVLLEKTQRKRITYGHSISRALRLLARLIVATKPQIITKVADISTMFEIGVKFANPLPRDMKEALAVEDMKLQAKLTSRHRALKEIMGRSANIEEVAIEILADNREAMLTDIERARAVEGGTPNLTTPFTGSLGLYVDKTGLMKRQEELVYRIQEKLDAAEEEKMARNAEMMEKAKSGNEEKEDKEEKSENGLDTE